jgi:hypothetical protein
MAMIPPVMRDKSSSPVMSHLRLLGTGSGPLSPACSSTTWIWNVHADAHDFRSYSDNFAIVSRQIFATHFGHVSLILLWMSGMFFSGARFSNYEAWLKDPIHIKPSSQIVWTVVNQDILNEDVCGYYFVALLMVWRMDRSPMWVMANLYYGYAFNQWLWANGMGWLVSFPSIRTNRKLVQ